MIIYIYSNKDWFKKIITDLQANKEQYLQLVTQWRMTRGIEEQTSAFLDGFNEVCMICVGMFV